MKKYDYLIVGSGISGAVFAHQAHLHGKRCLVLERRSHIGGNCYDEDVSGILVHRYGPHIFHTSNKEVWDYFNDITEFNGFINSPMANYEGELYNLPFNMNTFYRLWGIGEPAAVRKKLECERVIFPNGPQNLEEQALSLVGNEIYQKLVRDYTEKQWGRPCCELPAFIISRLPVRYTYDNNYFTDRYQGVPVGGYTALIEKLLVGCEVRLNTDFLDDRQAFSAMARKIVYTGPIDAFFGFSEGYLAYRSLYFEDTHYDEENHQGVAVMNYTDSDTPYTRTIEHKHFQFGKQPDTIVTREYPVEWRPGMEPYYPINDAANTELYERYRKSANLKQNVLFCGRLAQYRYYDMDEAALQALKLVQSEFGSVEEAHCG